MSKEKNLNKMNLDELKEELNKAKKKKDYGKIYELCKEINNRYFTMLTINNIIKLYKGLSTIDEIEQEIEQEIEDKPIKNKKDIERKLKRVKAEIEKRRKILLD